eukprot:6858671-Prymnesium_polylepis.1
MPVFAPVRADKLSFVDAFQRSQPEALPFGPATTEDLKRLRGRHGARVVLERPHAPQPLCKALRQVAVELEARVGDVRVHRHRVALLVAGQVQRRHRDVAGHRECEGAVTPRPVRRDGPGTIGVQREAHATRYIGGGHRRVPGQRARCGLGIRTDHCQKVGVAGGIVEQARCCRQRQQCFLVAEGKADPCENVDGHICGPVSCALRRGALDS